MRTVFLGTSEFAATVLRRLADSPHRPALVVTPPDSLRGRGRRELPPPVAEAAREGIGVGGYFVVVEAGPEQILEIAVALDSGSLEVIRSTGASPIDEGS